MTFQPPPFQPPVQVPSGYTIQLTDQGGLLECTGGTIFVPFGLPIGFYCTIVLSGDSTLTIDVQDAELKSATGATALTTRWQSVTLYSRNGTNDYVGLGMP